MYTLHCKVPWCPDVNRQEAVLYVALSGNNEVFAILELGFFLTKVPKHQKCKQDKRLIL